MSNEEARKHLETILARIDVLERIDAGVEDKRVMANDVGRSRPTIDRSIRELEELSLLRRERGAYRLTQFGEFVYREFGHLEQTVEALLSAKPLLEFVPDHAPFELDTLADATIVHSQPHAPQRPLSQLAEMIREGTRTRLLVPAVTPRLVETFIDDADPDSEPDELILTARGTDYLQSELDRQFHRLLQRPNVSVWRLPTDVKAGIGVVDGSEAWLGVYDSNGNVRGSFALDDEDVVENATRSIAAHRDRSNEVLPSEVAK